MELAYSLDSRSGFERVRDGMSKIFEYIEPR
jgi:hypothetical protein